MEIPEERVIEDLRDLRDQWDPREIRVQLDPREHMDPRERRDHKDQLALTETMDPRDTMDLQDLLGLLEMVLRDQCSIEEEMTLTTSRKLRSNSSTLSLPPWQEILRRCPPPNQPAAAKTSNWRSLTPLAVPLLLIPIWAPLWTL